MKPNRWFAVLAALVLVPTTPLWGPFLLLPAALLVVPCALIAGIAAMPAMVVAATSVRHETPRTDAPVSTSPLYTA